MPQTRLIWDTVQFSICNYQLLYLNQRWPRCWWIWRNKTRDNGPVNWIQGVARQHGGRKPQSCGSTQRYAVGKLSNIWWNAKCLYRVPHVCTLSVIFLITDIIKDGFFKNLKIISSKTIPDINSFNIILLCMMSYLWCQFHHKRISKCIIFF